LAADHRRELGEEHDQAPGQGNPNILGRFAKVLGKAEAEDQAREEAREKSASRRWTKNASAGTNSTVIQAGNCS
jgi:hypothetical protein